jgi:hypothetical protein
MDDELADAPIAWWQAKRMAEDLIFSVAGVAPAMFEFQVARDILALTLLFSGIDGRPRGLDRRGLRIVAHCLNNHAEWLAWCRIGLADKIRTAGVRDADRRAARNAWRWLRRSFKLVDSAFAGEYSYPMADPGVGCRIGVRLARRIVVARLTQLGD